MTLKEFGDMLATSGMPVAYLAFPADNCPSMPFITFQEVGSNNFGADGKVYQKVRTMQVDLFTSGKDETAEDALENALNDYFWNKYQTVEDSESCQRYTYTIEVFGGNSNGEQSQIQS